MTEQPEREEKATRKAWEEAGQHFSNVGKKIGEHYRNLEDEAESSAETQRQTVSDALKKVVDEVDQAFTGLGNALRDPQTKDSLNKAAKSLGDALDSTFSGLRERLRKGTSKKDTPGDAGQGDAGSEPSS